MFVMVLFLRKLISERNERLVFASIVVIAANVGGAWTPIGDVTTTMLWIDNRVTSLGIMTKLFLPSIFCIIIPLIVLSFNIKGSKSLVKRNECTDGSNKPSPEQWIVLIMGFSALLFVPVFEYLTDLPPIRECF